MLKRTILISLALTATVLLVGGYFYLGRTMLTGTDPFTAIDDNAPVFVHAESVTGFLSAIKNGSGFLDELGIVLNSKDLATAVSYLDSLFGGNPRASELTDGKSLYFSIHPSGRDKYDVVFYTALSSVREMRDCNEFIHEQLSGHAIVSERIYDRVRIYDVALQRRDELRDFSWAVSEGVFMLSFSPLLLENAISQLHAKENILEDDSFQKVFTTSGSNVDANVFINLRNFPRYISSFVKGDAKKILSDYTDLANWAELDLHIRENTLLLNGFSYSDVSENNYLNIFREQSPLSIKAESVIPGYVSAFLALGISDIPAFYKNYLEWLENTDRLKRHVELADEFREMTGSDPAGTFHSLMEGEVALVMTNWDVPEERGEYFLLVKTTSRSMAEEVLLERISYHAGITQRNTDSYRQIYRVDSETAFDIYRFPFSHTGELLFGKIFGTAETSYYSFVGNYLVLAESADGLSEFIHANVLNQTLDADTRFREFSEYLSSRNNLYFYSNVARSAGLFTGLFRQDLSASISANMESFRKFQALSLQFSSGRDMIYNNIFLKYSPRVVEDPHTEWQTLLDTVADFKPLLLLNHNTGENEIFVQDINNTIYLINKAGRILWKKPLPGRIMGNVYQVDYYKNNRLQMLFNTDEQIFLLDRNGNDVGRYPIRLPSPATNGISLFDYDNNKDYRIFVACEDKSVVVRSVDGNIVSGWNFPGTEHNVYQEIIHFRTDGRDYIVFNDRQRVYILDRRGNIRVRPDSVFPVSTSNRITFEGRTPGSDPRLVLTDTLGTVRHIYLNGRTETVKLGDYEADHFFDYQDVNANGYRDYIFVDNDRLDVFNREGSLMFSREFPVTVDHAPAYYHFSRQDRKLGIVSGESGQIFMVNSNGEIYDGFPLVGRSYFTIGFLESGQRYFNLIVGSNNNFLYNYTVY